MSEIESVQPCPACNGQGFWYDEDLDCRVDCLSCNQALRDAVLKRLQQANQKEDSEKM